MVAGAGAGIASNVARIANGVTRIAAGVALSEREAVEELLHIPARLVKQTAELRTAGGVTRIAIDIAAIVASVTRTATDFVARIATVVAASVARTAIGVTSSTRVAAAIAATSELEAFEELLEGEPRATTGITADVVARIAIGIASTTRITGDVAARIAIDIARTAGITAFRGKQFLQALSEGVLRAATVVATGIVARITIDDITRRTCHDTVTGTAFTHRARLAGDQAFET